MTTINVTPRTLDELLAHIAEARKTASDPPLTEPNRFHDDRFFSQQTATGTLTDDDGEQLVRCSPVELSALFTAINGDAAYRAGQLVALRDLARFVPRFEAEAGRPLEKMNLGRVLHSWWWPMRVRGWGALRFDMSQQQSGLMIAILDNPPTVDGAVGEPLARFLAGMFAMAFGLLARRELASGPLPRVSDGPWKFLIATPKRIRTAETLIQDGLPEADLLDRLAQAASLLMKPRS